MNRVAQRVGMTLLLAMLVTVRSVWADQITFIDDERTEHVREAQILGEGQGVAALELNDGTVQLVPIPYIKKREPKPPPTPVTAEEMLNLLRSKLFETLPSVVKAGEGAGEGANSLFPADRFRSQAEGACVTALVLAGPVQPEFEPQVQKFLDKASSFMNTVGTVFESYAKEMKFPLHDPRFPLVLMIFESDAEFEKYMSATSPSGLSVAGVTAFYSLTTNWLAVRMSSCDSFAVPLHEAVHLQMYNRVFHRFADIPKWFDEGIATGFENSGDKIDVSPLKVSASYARRLTGAKGKVDWQQLVAVDAAYSADVLAGEAYAQGWGLHWMLATQRKEQYQLLVQELAARETLTLTDQRDRIESFRTRFGSTPQELQRDFRKTLDAAIKRQKVSLTDPRSFPGVVVHQQKLGEVQLKTGGDLKLRQMSGQIKNISPFRHLTFYVTVEFSSGRYCDWLITNVEPTHAEKLESQTATKKLSRPPRPGKPTEFWIEIRSTPADSETAADWKNGKFPEPALN